MKTLLVWAAALPALCFQQPQRATLQGVVTDPSGRGVPQAVLEVRSDDPGGGATAVSNQRGEFVVSGLASGSYSVSTDVAGFKPFRLSGIRLVEGGVSAVNISLEINSMQSRVTVVSKAPMLEGQEETATGNHQEVLEIREVRESSSKDVGEALARLDGLWKIRKGGIANDIVLRGFQQDNVNVLVDGVRIYGACPNNMDPPGFHVDFAEVERVDVLKGPFDVRNQGGLAGTVNIVSKRPEAGFELTPTIAAGSFGYLNPSAVMSLATEAFSVSAGHSSRRSDPYHDGLGRPFTERANYNPDGLDQRAFDINTSWMRASVNPRRNHNVEFAYTRQRGGLVLYPYLMMDAPYDHADRLSASYDIGRPGGSVRRLTMRGYFTQVNHWMTDEFRITSAGAARDYGMATFAGTKALGGRVEAELSSGLVAGLESYRRNWNAVNTLRLSGQYVDQPMVPDVNAGSVGVYGEYRRTFRERLIVATGVRLDTGRSDARSSSLNTDVYWAYKGTRSLSRRDTYPSGSVWLAYELGRGFGLFSGIGRSVRQPDPQERYIALRRMGSDWGGDPNLAPTKNTEVDVGVNYRGRWFTFRPTFFHSHLSDFIVVHRQSRINSVPIVMNSAARSYAAVPARINGGEFSYSFSPHYSVLLSGGVSYARGTKQVSPALNILDRDLAEIPPLKSRAALRYGNRSFFVELESVAASAQARVDTDLKEQTTPGYAVWNVKSGIHTSRIKIAAGVDNLANRFYYEHFSHQRDPFRLGSKVPEPGRSWYLTASYAF